jgi:hypothetical protein
VFVAVASEVAHLLSVQIHNILIPRRRRQGHMIDGGPFAKRISVRGVALIAGGGCVLGALVFFAAPPFRQALRVALTPWYSASRVGSANLQSSLEALLRRARQNHDAEGLAFCAVRIEDGAESAHLATETADLDPKLLWIYAVVAARHPHLPEIGPWLSELGRWDAENALVPLLVAKRSNMKLAMPDAEQAASMLSLRNRGMRRETHCASSFC